MSKLGKKLYKGYTGLAYSGLKWGRSMGVKVVKEQAKQQTYKRKKEEKLICGEADKNFKKFMKDLKKSHGDMFNEG